MAVAKIVDSVEPDRLEWLVIEADDGRQYRYKRVGELDIAEPAQVEGHFVHGHPVRAALVRDADGHAFLRQPGAGLPASLVVEHIDKSSNGVLGSLGLSPKEEYTLVG